MKVLLRTLVMALGLALAGLILPAVAQATTAGTVTPNPLAFGSVVVNSHHAITVTIKNTGDVNETVSEVLSVTGGFSSPMSCDGVDLTPAATCTDEVDFDPSTTGAVSTDLNVTFTSDVDSSTENVDVPVTGTATLPAVRVTTTSLAPAIFYPLVRDGFRDFTTYRFTTSQAANGTVQLFNHKGTLTKSWSFSNRTQFAVAWGGRNRLGEKVKTGFYRFRVVAHAHGTTSTSGFRRVQVKTGFRLVISHGSKHKNGIAWSSRGWKAYQFGGNCNWLRDLGGLLTTCLEAHATISYTFELPLGAKVTSFSHSVSAGITPCRHALWTTSHSERIHHAVFTHGSFNDFSQCTVNSLTMAWKVTRKIRI
jgi:hypothetical protein